MATTKRDLGLALWLATDGEVRISERAPDEGDLWLMFLDPSHPLTPEAAECIQDALCFKSSNMEDGAQAKYYFEFDGKNQTYLRRSFQGMFNIALANLVKESWREGRWCFRLKTQVVPFQREFPETWNGKTVYRCSQGHNHETMTEGTLCDLEAGR